MIEQLIEAERALAHGLVDQAERLYRSVADHDPNSSIALVGLARVALERGDDGTAYVEAKRALAIDPENPAAQHLVMRLTEVMAGRGEAPPEVPPTSPAGGAVEGPAARAAATSTAPGDAPALPASPKAAAAPRPAPRRRRGFVDRLLGRRR
ncbi:MAG: tetratricopeptide repeat protein [Chloroflexota bacterium]